MTYENICTLHILNHIYTYKYTYSTFLSYNDTFTHIYYAEDADRSIIYIYIYIYIKSIYVCECM